MLRAIRRALIAQDHSTMNSSLQLRQLRTAATRWCRRRILFLMLSIVPTVTCSTLEIRRVKTCSGVVLRLRGDIRLGDFSQLKSQFRGKEAIIGFDLSSEGGILEEGVRIADFTRRKKLVVYVTGECNSVCADIFFAAAIRNFGAKSKIGVHSVSNDRDIEDAGSILLTIKRARLWAERGIPNSAIGKMVTTRPGQLLIWTARICRLLTHQKEILLHTKLKSRTLRDKRSNKAAQFNCMPAAA